MGRPSTMDVLQDAHRLAAGSLSNIAFATVTSRATGRMIQQAILNLRQSADMLETLLPAPREAGEGRDGD